MPVPHFVGLGRRDWVWGALYEANGIILVPAILLNRESFFSQILDLFQALKIGVPSGCLEETSIFKIIMIDDLLAHGGGSSDRSDPLGYGPAHRTGNALRVYPQVGSGQVVAIRVGSGRVRNWNLQFGYENFAYPQSRTKHLCEILMGSPPTGGGFEYRWII